MKAAYLILTCTIGFALPVQATVVTFEDVLPSEIADGYGGISGWKALGLIAPSYGYGLEDKVFTGMQGMLNFDLAPVVFEGLYYKSYAVDFTNPQIAIELYYQGSLVHSILDPVARSQLVYVDIGYSGLVDQVFFKGITEQFTIDNLSYKTAQLSEVPLPAAPILFASGAGFLAAARRRKVL